MRKNAICVLLALLLMLTLAACRKKDKQTEPTPTPTVALAPKPSAAATPKPTTDATPKSTPKPTPKPTRAPAEETPMPLSSSTPKPQVSGTPAPSAAPAAVAAAQSNAPVVTKQPNGEGHFIGESAVFITEARNWTSLRWTAVSPSGREVDMKTFRETFPNSTVIGESETTLTITNLNLDMSGWSFYCTFENENAKTRTESARLRVRDPNSASTSKTGSASAVTTKSKRLRCPHCGEEVPRDLLDCPYCGEPIYNLDESSRVTKDEKGDIFFSADTGFMYYDSSDRTSTYMDTSTNYMIFNDGGLVQSGNIYKEQQAEDEQKRLERLLNGEIDDSDLLEMFASPAPN